MVEARFEKDNLFGSTITYACGEGYELSEESNPTRTCQADGSWSGTNIPNFRFEYEIREFILQ